MRRILLALLACLVLAGGSGAIVLQHRCMGHWVDARVVIGHQSDDHVCDRCGMTRKQGKGCCQTVVKTIPGVDDYTSFGKWVPLVFSWLAMPALPGLPPMVIGLTQKGHDACGMERPPPLAGPPLWLRLRVLRL